MKGLLYAKNIRQIALYLAIPLLNAVTPMVVLPSLTSRFGAEGLAAYGLALSIGSAASLMGELGWGIVGPQKIASMSVSDRRAYYRQSVASKVLSLAVVVPIAAGIAGAMAPGLHRAEAALMCAGFALGAFSSAWFYIGENKPTLIIFFEALPKVILYSLAALAISAGAPLTVFALAVLSAVLVTLTATAVYTSSFIKLTLSDFRGGLRQSRKQLPLALGRAVSSAYTALPITLVALVAPASTALFTAVERLMRMGASILTGFHNRLQSWVGAAHGSERLRRLQLEIRLSFALGILGWAAFALLAPWTGHFIFSGTVTISPALALASGSVIFALCMTRGYGLALVAQNKANAISIANILSSVLGVALILLLARSFGPVGGAIGEFVAELVGVLIQAAVYYAIVKKTVQAEGVSR